MFKNPTDLAYRRSPLEAIGFYLVYLFIILMLSASVGFLVSSFAANGIETGIMASLFVGGLATTLLSVSLLRAKGLATRFGLVVLAFISGLISLYLSPLLGLLIAAWLSTR